MVNKAELEICRRRGHDPSYQDDKWIQCKWCKLWLRKVQEEREDAPPKNERSVLSRLNDK